jgi:hypothetical protein
MGMVKSIIEDLVETVEDMLTAVLGVVVVIFMAGTYYGSAFSNGPELHYPLYVFIALLVFKLAKDVVTSKGKKEEKKK